MKIKKFQGKTFKEVLELVKNDLGPDAVIISSTTKKDPLSNLSCIELTAALDDSKETSFNNISFENFDKPLQKEIEKIKIELALLRESVTKLFPTVNDNSKVSLYNFMIKSGIEPHLALLLLEKVSDINGLRELLDREIRIMDGEVQNSKGFIFFGLPGVGKTTSLFKLGKLIKNRNEKLMLLSLDQRISSVAYIKEMAIKLKCEAKIIKDTKDLYKIVHKEIDRTKILIDTPGDEKITFASELKNLLKDIPIRKCLLIDASMTTGSSIRTIKNVDSKMIDCIAFSKIDIAYNYGNIYNLHIYSGKPISFLTSGGYEDEKATIYPPRNVSNLIIGGLCEN